MKGLHLAPISVGMRAVRTVGLIIACAASGVAALRLQPHLRGPASICDSPRASTLTLQQPARRDAIGAAALAAASVLSSPAVPAFAEGRKFFQTDSGVKYFDLKEGNGYSPSPGQIVILNYKAYLSNGQMYDSSTGPGRKTLAATYKATPPQMLKGWEDVLGSMKEGGVRVIQVPPELAYGEKGVCLENGECLVPPNERLQFELSLERVVLPPP